MKPLFSGTRSWITLVLAAGVLLTVAVSLTMAKSGNKNWSKAILTVGNLSCGGCIDNIEASLAPIQGIGKISVDIAAGAADIYFNPGKIDDPQQIATAISEAGYPAKIERIVSAEQVSAQMAQFDQRAKTHIASVGQLEIPRQDFTTELTHARTRYEAIYGANLFSEPRGAQVMDRIKAQILSRLISDGVKLQEVVRAGFQVPPERVDKEMAAYLHERQLSMDQLKANLAESGYAFDYYQKKFAQRVQVQSYIEEIVLKESMDEEDRQQRYANWIANAKALAKVVIYDQTLEDLLKAGSASGCGGTSCSVSARK